MAIRFFIFTVMVLIGLYGGGCVLGNLVELFRDQLWKQHMVQYLAFGIIPGTIVAVVMLVPACQGFHRLFRDMAAATKSDDRTK